MSEVSFLCSSDRFEPVAHHQVLVVVVDPAIRTAILDACREAGVQAHGVASVAHVEHWPDGQTVIIDAEHLTPLWRAFGAAEVIVLVQSASEGLRALARGATGWVHLPVSRAAVAVVVSANGGIVQGTV